MISELIKEFGVDKTIKILSTDEVFLRIGNIDSQLKNLEDEEIISFKDTIRIYESLNIGEFKFDDSRSIDQKIEIAYCKKLISSLESLIETTIINGSSLYAEKFQDVVPVNECLSENLVPYFDFRKVFPQPTELAKKWYKKFKRIVGIIPEYGIFTSKDFVDYFLISKNEIKEIITKDEITSELLQTVMDYLDYDFLDFILKIRIKTTCGVLHVDFFSVPYHKEIVETIHRNRNSHWGFKLTLSAKSEKHIFCMSNEMILQNYSSRLNPETGLEVERYVDIFRQIPKGTTWKETLGYQFAYNKKITLKSGPPNAMFTLKVKFDKERGSCNICFDECDYKISCGHHFHPECFLQWNNKCSFCGQEIDQEIVKKYE